MTEEQWTPRDEVGRIRRVADMLCTAHADLRDRFSRRSFMLDVSILGLSTWLVALAFVEPRINVSLTPFGLEPQLWTGLLAVFTFLLSAIQLKVDWKAKSGAHQRSLDIYAEVKREAGYLLASGDEMDQQECRRVLARYDMASATAVAIPECDFLAEKQRHRTKVALSQHLDQYPFASISLSRIRFWLRDNFRREVGGGSGS